MKNLIGCPFIAIAKKPASHRGAQGVIYGSMIEEEYGNCTVNYGGEITDTSEYDALWIYHGNDYVPGAMNLFGGVYGFPYINNTVAFSKFRGKIFSLNHDMPPLHTMIGDKIKAGEAKGKVIQPEWYDVDMDNLERMYNEAVTVRHPNPTNKIVIGDSHAICMYRPGWMVNSVPFKTLNGALKTGLRMFVPLSQARDGNGFDEIEFYFGNIDIRHHLCRLSSSKVELFKNIEHLAEMYMSQCRELSDRLKAKVSIYELLPIEDESRKVPGSGHYKGKAFWGSWDERNLAKEYFNDYLEHHYGEFIRWTSYLKNTEGQLDFKHMEKPRSIHLARSSYPHWDGLPKTPSLQGLFS